MMRLVATACSILMLISPQLVNAGSFQSHASIYSIAKRFMQQHVAEKGMEHADIKLGTLDSRLKLHPCEVSLEAYMPRGSRTMGSTTIGVRCSGTKPWSINLPARVNVFRNVLVSTRTLTRGDKVMPGDLKLASRNLADLPHGYLLDYEASIGMDVKRRIQPDTAVTPSMLERPKLVRRGQRVNIIAQSGAARVKMAGTALAAGAVGDMVHVKNLSSERKVQGIVTRNGEVRVR